MNEKTKCWKQDMEESALEEFERWYRACPGLRHLDLLAASRVAYMAGVDFGAEYVEVPVRDDAAVENVVVELTVALEDINTYVEYYEALSYLRQEIRNAVERLEAIIKHPKKEGV